MEKKITIIFEDNQLSVKTEGFENRYELLGVLRTAVMTLEYPSIKFIEKSYESEQVQSSPSSSGE